MIKLKDSVRPRNLVIACAASNVAEALGITIYITSGNDSKHMNGSKHYEGNALDIRSKQPFKTKQDKLDFLEAVLKRLGPDYEGFLESYGKANEHFHIEYDPNSGV